MKQLTNLGQMWPKYLSLATFAYNTFNTPNEVNLSPYELVFGRKPKVSLNLETTPNIEVSGAFKDYHDLCEGTECMLGIEWMVIPNDPMLHF